MKAPKWLSALGTAMDPARDEPGASGQSAVAEPAPEAVAEQARPEPEAPSDPYHNLVVLSLFLHSAGTVEEMMSILVERAPKATGASVAFPLLAEGSREVLHARALEGCDVPGLSRLWWAFEADLTQVELPMSLGTTRRTVLDSGEVMQCRTLHELAEDVLGPEACDVAQERLNAKNVALVPMVIEGEPLGLLVFVFEHSNPDVEILELLAGHCAVGLRTLSALDEAARFGEIDQVTWAFGRRYFERALDDELRRSERYERGLSLVLLDIDGFSGFNRAYGSTLGDRLLRSVAMLLAESVSAPEMVARAGADEFAVLLPETDRARAVTVVNRMLDSVSQVNVFGGSGVADPVSVSVAITCYPDDGTSGEELLEAAAANLEEAKKEKAASRRDTAPGSRGTSAPRSMQPGADADAA